MLGGTVEMLPETVGMLTGTVGILPETVGMLAGTVGMLAPGWDSRDGRVALLYRHFIQII